MSFILNYFFSCSNSFIFVWRRQQQPKKIECNIFHFRRVEIEQRDGLKSDFGCSWAEPNRGESKWNGMRFDKHVGSKQKKDKKHTLASTQANRIAMRFFSSLFLYCTGCMRMLHYCCCCCCWQCHGSCFFPTFNF